MHVYENLAPSKLDDDVKISVVLREAPPKLRDNLLVSSQQFEHNMNKQRAIIQAYLNSNKKLSANDLRSDTKESDTMEVDFIGKDTGTGTEAKKQRSKEAKKQRSKEAKPDKQDK